MKTLITWIIYSILLGSILGEFKNLEIVCLSLKDNQFPHVEFVAETTEEK